LNSRSKGFTLISVIVAAFVSCIAVMAFGYVMNVSLKHLKQTNDLAQEYMKAKSILEQIRAADYDEVVSYNHVMFDKNKGSVLVSIVSPNLLKVEVKDGRVSIATLRSRY
jgi:Tfp pilus assembly protein PilV